MNKKLEKARELYVSVRTQAEQLKVDLQQRQVDRTGNVGGRAHQHLIEAQGNLERARDAASIEFQTAIDSVSDDIPSAPHHDFPAVNVIADPETREAILNTTLGGGIDPMMKTSVEE